MVSAIILCGGLSRRMGTDKGLIIFEGEPIIVRVLDKLKDYFDEILLILRDERQKREYLKVLKDYENVKIFTDIIKGQGPLGGLLTGLLRVNSGHALVVPCDSPFMTSRFIENCLKIDLQDYDAIIPVWDDGRIEPLHAIYNKRIVDRIYKLLSKDERRVSTLVKTINSRLVPVDELDPSLESFRNVNKPEDLGI